MIIERRCGRRVGRLMPGYASNRMLFWSSRTCSRGRRTFSVAIRRKNIGAFCCFLLAKQKDFICSIRTHSGICAASTIHHKWHVLGSSTMYEPELRICIGFGGLNLWNYLPERSLWTTYTTSLSRRAQQSSSGARALSRTPETRVLVGVCLLLILDSFHKSFDWDLQ